MITGRLRVCLAAGVLAVLLEAPSVIPAFAVTLDWDDLTDAQQEQAYHQLESENQALREQLEALRAQTGESGSSSSSGISSGSSESGSQASQDGTGDAGDTQGAAREGSGGSDNGGILSGGEAGASQLMDTETFLADLASSFNARQQTARTHTNEEVNAMDEADMWDFRFMCAEVERPFYEKYNTAQFDDLNVYYLCTEYCLGLDKQFQAEDIWNSSQNSEEANRLYTAGYYNRAYALVELCEYYGLDLAEEYQNLKNAVSQMDALSGDETRNASVDPAKIMQVQELLNSLGFLCGSPDGIAGRQTASCIERFQSMYGYEPADGLIDDELIAQMSEQLARRQQ